MAQNTEHTAPPRVESAQLMKAKPLAAKLNCSVAMIYIMARQGIIPCVKIGRTGVRFVAADVIAALTRAKS